MNKIKNILFALAVMCGLTMSSCSDEHMISVNTDDTKSPTANPNNLLTTGMLQTYGDFDMMDTYRCYITGFTQYYSGGWNVSTFAGSNMFDNEYSRKMWDKFYGVAIKNIVQGIEDTKDQANINAVLRIYRVYLLSLIVDTYGDAPCREAGYAAIKGITYPKYDTQKEAYEFFFSELKECVAQLSADADKVTGDVSTMGGNLNSWKKFANSLRMRFAMRISDVEPATAQAEFESAINADGGYVSTASDNVFVKYLKKSFTFYPGANDLDFRVNALSEMLYGQDPTSPTFICKTLYKYLLEKGDPRLYRICRCYLNATRSEVAAEGCYDITEEIVKWGEDERAIDPNSKAGIQPNEVGEAWWCAWPTIPSNDKIPTLDRLVKENPNAGFDQNNFPARMTRPFLNIAFEQADCPGVLFTSAEAEFLLAEAKMLGWNVPGTMEEHYAAGVRSAMEFLNANYNITAITENEINEYLANNPLGGNPKESINLQAWILHLTNPVEGWANQRRSDYPALKDRRSVPTESSMKIGEDDLRVPARLRYPTLEEENNSANYKAAISRQPDDNGSYSWHSRVWWDTKEINYYNN